MPRSTPQRRCSFSPRLSVSGSCLVHVLETKETITKTHQYLGIASLQSVQGDRRGANCVVPDPARCDSFCLLVSGAPDIRQGRSSSPPSILLPPGIRKNVGLSSARDSIRSIRLPLGSLLYVSGNRLMRLNFREPWVACPGLKVITRKLSVFGAFFFGLSVYCICVKTVELETAEW